MGRARVTSILTSKWLPKTAAELDEAVLDMATDIHRQAVIKAPKLSRNLANSGDIRKIGAGHYSVTFGGQAVPYARRRHFENFKNPGTLLYLSGPGDLIARAGLGKYLRRI